MDGIKLTTGIIETLEVVESNMKKALIPEMLATDVAYYLVREKGFEYSKLSSMSKFHYRVPFREAHEIAGKVISNGEKLSLPISQLPLETFSKISEHFGDGTQISSVLKSFENSVEQYTSIGGTSRDSILNSINTIEKIFEK